MKNKMCHFVFSSLLFFVFEIFPTHIYASTANITQINFTNAPQTIDINTVSAQLTTQTQNSGGSLEQLDTSGTVLQLSSSSATGEFSSNATNWIPVSTLGMNNGTANRNFYYKDSTAGTHTLTITAQGKSWTAAVQSITINPPPDTTAPVITLTGANPQTIEVGGTYSELGATVSDNVGIGLTVTIDTSALNLGVLGSYSIKYNTADAAGNAAVEVTRTVQVVDTTKPVIALTGSGTINSIVGDVYTEQSATVSDNYDTGLTVTIAGDSVDTTTTGTYTITYNAVDSSGNNADQITRTVVYGPVPTVLSGGSIYTPPVQTVDNNPTIPSEPAQAISASTNTETFSASSPTPTVDTIPAIENSPVVIENIQTASTTTSVNKDFQEKTNNVPENKELNEPVAETLTASVINADTPSNAIPLTIGTLSGALLLFGAWKLKLFN